MRLAVDRPPNRADRRHRNPRRRGIHRARPPAAACSGCRVRCTSRAVRCRSARSMISTAVGMCGALGRLVDIADSESSASHGTRSRGRPRPSPWSLRDGARAPSPRRIPSAGSRARRTAAAAATQPGAAAVLVQRFHAHVPGRKRLRADDLGEKRLRSAIAVQHVVLGAFLVIEHDLQRRRASPGQRGAADCAP